MWDSYQLVGHAVRAWVCLGLYGLSGVENIWGGVWVVLKLEWKPLHQGAPPVKSCRVRSSFGPASSSHLSPSWPLGRHGGFLLLVQPHHHLSFFGSSGDFLLLVQPHHYLLLPPLGLSCSFRLGSKMNASFTSIFF